MLQSWIWTEFIKRPRNLPHQQIFLLWVFIIKVIDVGWSNLKCLLLFHGTLLVIRLMLSNSSSDCWPLAAMVVVLDRSSICSSSWIWNRLLVRLVFLESLFRAIVRMSWSCALACCTWTSTVVVWPLRNDWAKVTHVLWCILSIHLRLVLILAKLDEIKQCEKQNDWIAYADEWYKLWQDWLAMIGCSILFPSTFKPRAILLVSILLIFVWIFTLSTRSSCEKKNGWDYDRCHESWSRGQIRNHKNSVVFADAVVQHEAVLIVFENAPLANEAMSGLLWLLNLTICTNLFIRKIDVAP